MQKSPLGIFFVLKEKIEELLGVSNENTFLQMGKLRTTPMAKEAVFAKIKSVNNQRKAANL